MVGDVRVGVDEYERVRRQQIDYFERVLGDQFDPRKLGDDMIDGATIRLLVERALAQGHWSSDHIHAAFVRDFLTYLKSL